MTLTILTYSCRAHKEKECAASECSLLCNDYLRLGYNNMVVDPGVRQAYSVKDAVDLYNPDWVSSLCQTLNDVTDASATSLLSTHGSFARKGFQS